MRIVADESVEAYISEALAHAGHEVFQIAIHAAGLSDQEVLDIAFERGELLITNDKDFGDLVFAKGGKHYGILLMRLSGLDVTDKCARMVMLAGTHGAELMGSFTTVGAKSIRIRKQL